MRRSEGFWKGGDETSKWGVKCSEVQQSELM